MGYRRFGAIGPVKLKNIFCFFRTPVRQVLGSGGEQRHRLSTDESSAGKHGRFLSVS